MFKFFKEKIKSWVKKSAEAVETAGLEETTEEEIEKKIKKGVSEEKKPDKAEEPKEAEKKSFFRKIKEKAFGEEKEAEKPEAVKEEKKEETEKEELERLEEEIKEVEKEVEEEAGRKERERLKEDKEAKEIEELEEEVEEIEKEVEEEEKKEKIEKLYEPGIEKPEEEAKKIELKGLKPEEVKEPEPIGEEKAGKDSIFKRLKQRFSYKLSEGDFEDIFQDLELMLLESNVALEATEAIKKQLQKELIGKEIKKDKLEEEIKAALKKSIEEILIEPDDLLPLIKEKKPFVIVFFGINGTGKTTTIAKTANLLLKNNISCVLAAADTFRAAAIEQLQHHADNLKIKVIKHDYGADPAAVAFDAIKHAKAHDIDAVLIDTAGRMHTQDNLLSEMEKICRVTDPDLKIFVAESIAGNDAIQQARNFDEKIGIDGTILTKADVDEKGGTAISIGYVTKKPILFLGTGQEYDNLVLFDKEKFIEELGL